MKYESNTKIERNQMIVKLRNSGATFEEIAKYFNISRQRAYELYKREKGR